MGNPTPDTNTMGLHCLTHLPHACQIKCSSQDGRLVDRGGGEGSRCTALRGGVMLGGPTVTAVAGEDMAAYFSGNQDRCSMFILGRSGPNRVLGNLFPAREIYFPGINSPTPNCHYLAFFRMEL